MCKPKPLWCRELLNFPGVPLGPTDGPYPGPYCDHIPQLVDFGFSQTASLDGGEREVSGRWRV